MTQHLPFPALALAVCRIVAPSGAALAQSIPESAYGALHWRLIGPHRGGRVLAVAGIAGDPATFYFGAVDGGVWRTANAGVTWDPLFDGQPIASIGAMAVAPSDPRIIYVGTGEASIRSDITYGAGVYKSSDGGATWHALGLEETRHIGKVLVDPANPDVVLVAALGHAYGPNAERGVFRGSTSTRPICCESARPMCVQLLPPSADLYMPSPWAMSERMSASPEPT